MQVWIECPQFRWIGVWMTQWLMHEHVGKRAKMRRKPNGWRKASKAIISTSHEVKKGVHQAHQPTPQRCISQVVTPNKSLGGMDVIT